MPGKARTDDQQLTRYLLGTLPAEEAERLDEMSISDDEIAWRLRAVEDDLVDSYVRGELSGDALAEFRASYLSSPQKREKVAIAEALLALDQRRAAPAEPPARIFAFRPLWAVAAAIAVIAVGVYLLIAPMHLASNRTAAVVTRRPPPARPAPLQPLATISFDLAPPLRSAGALANLAIPSGTQQVTLRVQLESDDFPAYAGALRDLSSNQVVWRSEPARATHAMVPLTVPASVLEPRDWSLELSGLPREGSPDVVGSYSFRVSRATR